MLLHNTSHQVNECINTMLRVKRDRCFKCQEMLEESRCFCSQHPGQLVPVEPNPPSPRSVTSRLASSCNQLLPKRPNDKKMKTGFTKPNSPNQNLIVDLVQCQRKIPKIPKMTSLHKNISPESLGRQCVRTPTERSCPQPSPQSPQKRD